MKKTVKLFVSGLLLVSLGACSTTTTQETESSAELPNPMVEYETMEEVEDKVGFGLYVPDEIQGYTQSSIFVYELDNPIIEVTYGDEKQIVIRKAEVSEEISNFSGVYTEYAEEETIAIQIAMNTQYDVQVKGEDGLIHVCEYNGEVYQYSIYCEAGMTKEELTPLVQIIG